MSIESNLNKIKEQIHAAVENRSSRIQGTGDNVSRRSVTLIAVSKTKSIEQIESALAAGQLDFGENYVQEAVSKVQYFIKSGMNRPKPCWHFIGSLQTNKVKEVVGNFQLIHSVDRESLLNKIQLVAQSRGLVQDVLLQMHVGSETTKHGATWEEIRSWVQRAFEFPNLNFRGLMCMPPLNVKEEVARGYFAELCECRDAIRGLGVVSNFDYLSMGTSQDFVLAIEEGATHVRIGSSIFGEREKRL